MTHPYYTKHIDFEAINRAALERFASLLRIWLPAGEVRGREYVALNPTRNDRHLGSFKINIDTGRWAEFATDECGGDPVSLRAYIDGSTQSDAARAIAKDLGVHDV